MKILIIQTAFIGDVILTTPIIERLKEFDGDCKIDYLLRKGVESIFENHPHLNQILIYDKQRKYHSLFKLIAKIRSQSYDYVINIHRSFISGVITCTSGGQYKFGFDKNPLSFLYTKSYTHQISSDNFKSHEVKRNLALIASIANSEFMQPKLYPTFDDLNKNYVNEKYICIAPTSLWNTKMLPLLKWSELIKKLPDHYSICLIGSLNDINLCERIKENISNKVVLNFAGELTLLQSASLISKAKLTFANDSAALHLASSMNAPIVAVYCSTVPQFGFGPLSDVSFIIENNQKLACRPCGIHGRSNCRKKHFKCSEINIDDLLLLLRKHNQL